MVREKLRTWVSALVSTFPQDLRLAVTTPLALHDEAQHPFLAHRIQWLAELADRDSRTIRRRIDDGLTRLVEAASRNTARDAATSPDGWHIGQVHVLLRLDGPVPACTERWTIAAERDGVEEIDWAHRHEAELSGGHDIHVVHGVLLTDRGLRLPRPLRAGETQEFSLDVRIPRIHRMPPFYQFRTSRRCDRFDLVVRFHPDRLPAEVNGIGDAVEHPAVNSVGEVEMSFLDVIPGRDNGIRWTPQQGETGIRRHTPTMGSPRPFDNAVTKGPASWALGQTGS
ncbi:MAG TPA: hypothetical protein VNO31_11890 [Umezawaea sp.]|nr:hypothetical protein [Umezawaea sp.]